MKIRFNMKIITRLGIVASALALTTSLRADVTLSNIFGDHMVLQQGRENPVWGWADAGEVVTVSIAGQTHKTIAHVDARGGSILSR